MIQGYLVIEPERAVRVRIPDAGPATLSMKGPARGAIRDEYEHENVGVEGQRIRKPIIEETRQVVECNGDLWEIDSALMASREMTEDPGFINAALVDRPHAHWTKKD